MGKTLKKRAPRTNKARDLARLDAEVEDLVQHMDGIRIELENEVKTLKKTIEVNRQDTFGMKMRASGIHAKAVQLLVAAYRADKIRDLRYPPSDSVERVLKAAKTAV